MTERIRRNLSAAAVLAAVVAVHVSGVSAQSLADLAKDRKQPAAKPAEKSERDKKVYTNRDLGPGGPTPAPGPAAAAQPEAKDASKPATAKPAEQAEVRDEAWWRKRITTARTDLQRNELFLEALQSRVNALSMDFVNRDDPAQRQAISGDRQRALAEMERVRGEIANLKKQIVDIEEEARVAGVPPGWLR